MLRIFLMDHPVFQMISDSWKSYLSLGLFSIVLALLIFVFPEIIAYLFATLLLAIGIVLLVLAYRAFQTHKAFTRWFEF